MPDVQETKSRLADETVGSGKPGYHFIAPKGCMSHSHVDESCR